MKAIVTSEIIDTALSKVEAKVAADQDKAAGEGVAVQGANAKGVPENAPNVTNKAAEEVEAVEMAPEDGAN